MQLRSPRAKGRGIIAFLFVVSMIVSAFAGAQRVATSRVAVAVAQDEPAPSGNVIVILNSAVAQTSSSAEVRSAAVDVGIAPTVVFSDVVDGYAANVTQAQADDLANDPSVAAIFPDRPVYEASQSVEPQMNRVGATSNSLASINGLDERVEADVAVLDSGIDLNNPDLNVVGGYGCTDAGPGVYDAGTNHGTHVAGIIGALDNDIGVVGVAPGARLWSIRVLAPPDGVGLESWVICGLDWVMQHRSTIDVVNLSLTTADSDTPCTRSTNASTWTSPLHEAICRVYDAGIPIAAAAGNGGIDASSVAPATYDEVIAVSAFADSDGLPGGLGGACGGAQDDYFAASYSNFGPDVDIAAPGNCIRSTGVNGGLTIKTGTSMACAFVTGAIALYKAKNPQASPAEVKAWLLSTAIPQNSANGLLGGDPDGSREPLLYIGDQEIPTATATAVVTIRGSYALIGSDRSPNSSASSYVRDGRLSTYWYTKPRSSPPSSAWVYVALSTENGEAASIGSIRWVFGKYGWADRYYIETSTDLQTWTRIAKRTNKPVGQWQEVVVNPGVQAKYVRFRFENPNGDNQLGGIAEIAVFPPGVTPLSPTPTPSPTPEPTKYTLVGGGKSSNSATDSTSVRDGNFATYWRTKTGIPTPTTGYVYVYLGSQAVPVKSIRWTFAVTGMADKFYIDASPDGKSWSHVSSQSRTNAPVNTWQELQTDTSARYIRFYFYNPNNDPVIGGISEIEVWSGIGGYSPIPPSATPTATAAGANVTSTPTATPTATNTPTPTATVTPTDTPVDTPTPTDTPVATDTPVPADTPTDTPAPTETPTETPTVGGASVEETPTVEAAESAPYAVRRVRFSGNSRDGENAIDGDPTTVWLTDERHAVETAFLLLDLGSVKPVGAIRWLFDPNLAAGAYVVEISTDRRTWTPLVTDGSLSPGEWQELTVDADARFVRFSFTNPESATTIGGLAEVEIWP